jgi:ABC-type Na+ efflux pump permease subunit
MLDRMSLARWLAWLPGPSLDGNPVLWREWHRNRPSRLARIIWVVYTISSVAGAGIGMREAIVNGTNSPNGFFTLIIGLHLQFLFGLMILTSLAPTSLAEERVRGSLDVLLTTPLSTRSIVWGKWLGTYRVVLLLSILPGVISVFVAGLVPPLAVRFTATGRPTSGLILLDLFDRIVAPSLVVGEMLAYGAAITSTGLALATWVPRLGRAIAINIVIFVLITAGWPIFIELFIGQQLRVLQTTGAISDTRWIHDGLLVISPFAAPMFTLDWLVEHRGYSPWKFWLFATAWCTLAWAFAAALFWATVLTFDRCLGRMPAWTRQPTRTS